MKRFRLSTLLLLVIIAALGFALVVQHQRARQYERELRHECRSAEIRAENAEKALAGLVNGTININDPNAIPPLPPLEPAVEHGTGR